MVVDFQARNKYSGGILRDLSLLFCWRSTLTGERCYAHVGGNSIAWICRTADRHSPTHHDTADLTRALPEMTKDQNRMFRYAGAILLGLVYPGLAASAQTPIPRSTKTNHPAN